MYMTAIAVLCHLMVPHPTIAPDRDCTPEEARVEEIVSDSSMDEHLDFFACQIGAQQALAKWKGRHPIYRRSEWRIAQIKCAPGKYVLRGQA